MLPRILTRPLRTLLVRLHPFVSCCSSCGEIPTPLEGRLCTSLSPEFPVDGLLPDASPQEAREAHNALPWLRRVHGSGLLAAPLTRDSRPQAMLAALADLARNPELAEHFFLAFRGSRLGRISMVADLFTPNGIPLLRAQSARVLPGAEEAWCAFLEEKGLFSGRAASFASDIFPSGKECLTDFVSQYGDFLATAGAKNDHGGTPRNAGDVCAALARWSFASALAIPAGPLCSLSAAAAP